MIAILASLDPRSGSFGAQESFLREMLDLCRRSNVEAVVMGLLFENGVMARCVRPDGTGWRETTTPQATACYDRVFPPGAQVRSMYRSWLDSMASRFLWVNSPELSPLTADKLWCADFCKRHGWNTPDAWPLKDVARIMEPEPPGFVVKPRWGGGGRRTLVIEQCAGNTWRVSGDGITMTMDGDRLTGHLAGLSEDEENSFILQRLVPIRAPAQPAMDLRFVVQRGRLNRARVTGAVARVMVNGGTRSNHPGSEWMTNLTRGALAYPPVMALRRFRGMCGDLADRTVAAAAATAREIHAGLERHCGPVGELAVDMLVDVRGGLWVVDLNSKPGKIAFQRLSISTDLAPSMRRFYATVRRRLLWEPIEFLLTTEGECKEPRAGR
ncbi:hypothetical protein JW905_13330 [bacterium]|nr:hypothetical protein [candidate division CSSED10-310 bacterium]